jgi:hypothetical protein
MNILKKIKPESKSLINSNEYVYNIHNLMYIILCREVSDLIIKDINFQIGFFLTDNNFDPKDLPKIFIYPYKNKNNFIDANSHKIFFYDEVGVLGSYLDNSEKRLFVCRKNKDLIICADHPNFLINLYIQILLIEQNCTLIHASAYQAKSGKINIFTGAGGTGKTAILGHAVSQMGLKYLGDDLVIINLSKECFSFPRHFVLKKYHSQIYSKTFSESKIYNFNFSYLKRFLHENLPFVGIIKTLLKKIGFYYRIADKIRPKDFLTTISPEKIFGINKFVNRGTIGSIIYLDKTIDNNFLINQTSAHILSNRIMSVIHHEFRDYNNHLLSLGALNVINYNIYMKNTSEILNDILNNIQLFKLSVPNNSNPADLIDFLIKNNLFD